MPAPIDRDKREQEITDAAFRLLSERGPSALTLRALAKELGGSITLVTHFFSNRGELLKAITDRAIAGYDAQLQQLEQDPDPHTRLRMLLEWMLPLDAEDRRTERGRVMLVGQSGSDFDVSSFFIAMDRKMRQLLSTSLAPLVPAEQLEDNVEFFRTLINGVVLSSAEHPTKWPRKRQLALLAHALRISGLDQRHDSPPGIP